MGWSGAILVTATVLVIAGVSAAGGFWLAVSGRAGARPRGPFLLGVVCGFAAGLVLTGRRHGLRAAVGAAARAIPAAASVARRKPVARRPARFAAVPYLRAAWSWTGSR